MLGDLVKNIRLGQRELTEAREYLQIQWRQAQARVVQASQLRGHQKKANKVHYTPHPPPPPLYRTTHLSSPEYPSSRRKFCSLHSGLLDLLD